MRTTIRTCIAIAAFALLAACGGPKIDAKNATTFQESVENISRGLERQEATQFGMDIQTISKEILGSAIMTMDTAKIQQAENEIMNRLDGMTASDVHEEAERIRNKS